MKKSTACLFILSIALCLIIRANAQPVCTWDEAGQQAQDIVSKMAFEDKVLLIEGGGKIDGHFALKAFPEYGIPHVRMADATSGLRVSGASASRDYPGRNVPDEFKSTAYPCNMALAASFNRELVAEVAGSIGEAARAKGIHIMLGPSVNLYRVATCGRNYEYTSEDPFLASEMVAEYVEALQSRGVLATVKVLAANNMEFLRKKSNSQIDPRSLREIYLKTFAKTIERVGVTCLMTSYNLVNGKYTGEDRHLLTDVLRGEMGFRGLMISDWHSVYDHEKFLTSGLDLVMPVYPHEVRKGLKDGTVDFRPFEKNIDQMIMNLLQTCIYMGYLDQENYVKPEWLDWKKQDQISEKAAEEGSILLKNDKQLLPIDSSKGKRILLTGPLALKTPELGAGSGHVYGWDRIDIHDGLVGEFGKENVQYQREPSARSLKKADYVIVSVGFLAMTEGESSDHPFELPADQVALIKRCAAANPNTVVTITAGGSVRMVDWNDKVPAILHTLYLGQKCGRVIARTISGEINPSGKLPFTMERELADSVTATAYPKWAMKDPQVAVTSPDAAVRKEYDRYLDGEITLHDFRKTYIESVVQMRKVAYERLKDSKQDYYTVDYNEGIFVGHRYYEKNKIPVMYPFGHGLSYTSFVYSDLAITGDQNRMQVRFTIKNTGSRAGAESAQVYVGDLECSVERPLKELKGFGKVFLKPGESREMLITLDRDAWSFWHPETKAWTIEPGKFSIQVGRSSADIVLKKNIQIQ